MLQNAARSGWQTVGCGPMKESFIPRLVSVIVPVYNRRDWITDTLDSVWMQTYRPVELIVVDDGSNDGSIHRTLEWKESHRTDPGFTVQVLKQENSGAPVARNLGLISSSGEFIQFLDSDDMIQPDKFARQVAELQRTRADAVVCDFVTFDSEGMEVIRKTDTRLMRTSRSLLAAHLDWDRGSPLYTTGLALYRRASVVAVGPWNENLPIWQDFEYNARFLSWGPKVAHVAAELFKYRLPYGRHTISGVNDLQRLKGMFESVRAVKKMLRASSLDARYYTDCLARRVAWIARCAIQQGATGYGSQLMVWALINAGYSRKIKYAGYIFLVAMCGFDRPRNRNGSA